MGKRKKVEVIIHDDTEETPVESKTESAARGLQPDVGVQRWQASEVFHREAAFNADGIDKERRMCSMSISSELPVSRGDYDEVLSHDPGDCDMSRISSGSHPLLLNHDSEKQIGVVESARIDGDKRIRATVRFSKSQLGDEIWQDVQDGIRRLVSVGYRRTREVRSETVNGREVVRFAWQPYEASIVSVPADATVGIGRKQEEPQIAPAPEPTVPSVSKKDLPMSEKIEVVDNSQMLAERKRVTEIQAISKNMATRIPGCADECQKAIAEGTAVAALQDKLFTMLPNVTPVGRATLDLPEKEAKRYSITRAINRASEGKLDGLEKELSDECARVSGTEAKGFYLPHSILTRANNTVGTATMGGNLVASQLQAGSFIEILRNRAQVAALGARMLDGLVGKVLIPRQLAAATAYWEGEEVSTTQSNTGFDQLTLSPKAVTGYEIYSKQLLIQSTPSVDALIRDDLLNVLALAIDKVALVTDATSQGPTSIGATTGIATVTCSTAGIIPTFANIIALESEVAVDNADVGNLAYLTNSKVRGALKSAIKSTYSGAYGFIWETNETMNGYRAAVTNQLASNNTVGTLTTICSSIYFGNWNDLIIATWGAGTDVVIDPYTNAATRGVRVFASQWVDLGVRHASSFAVINDALTA